MFYSAPRYLREVPKKLYPHHRLIYGAPYDPEIIDPNDSFYLMMSGDPEPEDHWIGVGFDYGKIDSLFDRYSPTKSGVLSPASMMSRQRIRTTLTYIGIGLECSGPVLEAMFWSLVQPRQPSDQIKAKFAQEYPGAQADTYAIIQDVHTSEYCGGYLAYGYWVDPITCQNSKITPLSFAAHQFKHDQGITEIHFIRVAHIMKTPSVFFCGTKIQYFPPLAQPADASKLAKKLSQVYLADDHSLPSKAVLEEYFRSKGLTELCLFGATPELVIFPTTCHCCT